MKLMLEEADRRFLYEMDRRQEEINSLINENSNLQLIIE